MTSQLDIDRSAWVLIKQYGDDALLEAAERANEPLAASDWDINCRTNPSSLRRREVDNERGGLLLRWLSR